MQFFQKLKSSPIDLVVGAFERDKFEVNRTTGSLPTGSWCLPTRLFHTWQTAPCMSQWLSAAVWWCGHWCPWQPWLQATPMQPTAQGEPSHVPELIPYHSAPPCPQNGNHGHAFGQFAHWVPIPHTTVVVRHTLNLGKCQQPARTDPCTYTLSFFGVPNAPLQPSIVPQTRSATEAIFPEIEGTGLKSWVGGSS